MEKLINIITQSPLASRQYTTQQGEQKTFHSVGFVLTDGLDTFYGEIVGDAALSVPQYDKTVSHMMQGQMSQREYQDRNGETRHENRIYISKLI